MTYEGYLPRLLAQTLCKVTQYFLFSKQVSFDFSLKHRNYNKKATQIFHFPRKQRLIFVI